MSKVAARAIGRLTRPTALATLEGILRDGSEFTYEEEVAAVAAVLGRIGDAAAVEPLVAFLSHQHSWMVLSACEALYRLGDAETAQLALLTAGLRNSDVQVRVEAALSLAELDDPRAFPILEQRIYADRRIEREGEWGDEVFSAIAQAFGRIGTAGAIENLLYLYQDHELEIRLSTVSALAGIETPQADEALLAPAQPLMRALGLPKSDRHEAVVAALGKAGFIRALDALFVFLPSSPRVTELAAKVTATLRRQSTRRALEEALKEDDPQVRVAAATALGRVGDSHSADLLAEALASDIQYWVQTTAAEALGHMDSLESRAHLTRTIASYDDIGLRVSAARALSQSSDPAALDSLMARLVALPSPFRGTRALAPSRRIGPRRGLARCPSCSRRRP